MKRLISFLLVLFFGLNVALKADASYSGHISLKGLLGESTNFELELEYYGNDECIVKGQTIYTRKNGSKSIIPAYGVWEVGTSGRMYISEIYDGKVCGTFNFVIDGEPSEDDPWQPLDGFWRFREKELQFNNVQYVRPNEKYEATEFIKFLNKEEVNFSGKYTYYYIGKYEDTPIDKRTVLLNVNENNVDWTFELQKQVYNTTIKAESTYGGYKNHQPGKTWHCFSIGNAEFDVIAIDDAILIYQCNPECVPDGKIPLGYQVVGVYFKEADSLHLRKTRSFSDTDPDAVSYYDLSISVPRISNQTLNQSIHSWIAKRLNSSTGKDLWAIANREADSYLEGVYDPRDDMPDGIEVSASNLYSLDLEIGYLRYDEPRVINMFCSGYDFTGGIHGMPFNTTQSIRRSDGKVLDWAFFFNDPDKIRPIFDRNMRAQNNEVDFDNEGILELPGDDPWYENGKIYFQFGPYEAAAYCYGMPSCAIPVNELLPYLTPEAKKLVK